MVVCLHYTLSFSKQEVSNPILLEKVVKIISMASYTLTQEAVKKGSSLYGQACFFSLYSVHMRLIVQNSNNFEPFEQQHIKTKKSRWLQQDALIAKLS